MNLLALFFFRRPQTPFSELQNRLGDAPFTYPLVGETRNLLPEGWTHEDQTAVIGHGPAAFERAKAGLQRWTQFELGWVEPVNPSVPLVVGELFVFRARHFGLWSLNACRIIYVVDETLDDRTRFGFGYGTVGLHAIVGEERFMLVYDHQTDEVRFQLRKFSRPSHRLLRWLGPLTRYVQRTFTRDALAHMTQVAT